MLFLVLVSIFPAPAIEFDQAIGIKQDVVNNVLKKIFLVEKSTYFTGKIGKDAESGDVLWNILSAPVVDFNSSGSSENDFFTIMYPSVKIETTDGKGRKIEGTIQVRINGTGLVKGNSLILSSTSSLPVSPGKDAGNVTFSIIRKICTHFSSLSSGLLSGFHFRIPSMYSLEFTSHHVKFQQSYLLVCSTSDKIQKHCARVNFKVPEQDYFVLFNPELVACDLQNQLISKPVNLHTSARMPGGGNVVDLGTETYLTMNFMYVRPSSIPVMFDVFASVQGRMSSMIKLFKQPVAPIYYSIHSSPNPYKVRVQLQIAGDQTLLAVMYPNDLWLRANSTVPLAMVLCPMAGVINSNLLPEFSLRLRSRLEYFRPVLWNSTPVHFSFGTEYYSLVPTELKLSGASMATTVYGKMQIK